MKENVSGCFFLNTVYNTSADRGSSEFNLFMMTFAMVARNFAVKIYFAQKSKKAAGRHFDTRFNDCQTRSPSQTLVENSAGGQNSKYWKSLSPRHTESFLKK